LPHRPYRRTLRARTCLGPFALIALTSGCGVLFPDGGGGSAKPIEEGVVTGCLSSPPKTIAPGGYYVNGNTICTADGHPHLFHGVDRPSMEWTSTGDNLSAADFELMASWKANVVRIALNQDFWLSASPYHDDTYVARVDNVITWAEQAGMDVILDLHWSDAGVLGSCNPANGCQQVMADENSITFWQEVATRYKNDGRVLFELYNEPHDVNWSIWRKGGEAGLGWRVVGMQQLHDAVRAAGAENLVIVGGLGWAYDLRGVPANRITGHNIVYATHPYGGTSDRAPGTWDASWGFLTVTDPVIATEFGNVNGDCSADYTSKLIEYADKHNAGWTAWAWFPGGCKFPAIIADWNGTPSETGTVVKAALARYNDPAPGGRRAGGVTTEDAGTPGDGGYPPDGATPADGGTD
jgi:endoglucanase